MPTIGRRQFLGRVAGAGAAVVAATPRGTAARLRGGAVAPPGVEFVYVGCFSDRDRDERGEGISVYRVGAGGRWTLVDVVRDAVNPGCLVLDGRGRTLYASHARSDKVSAYSAFRLPPVRRQPVHRHDRRVEGG